MNDEQLVALCKRGDKPAFEELIRRYYLPLSKFFYKLLRNSNTCEDLAHDVIVKLIENIDKYKPIAGAKFSTWLFKIAYNKYVDYLNKNPVNREMCLEESSIPPAPGCDLHDDVWKSMENERVRRVLCRLPDEMRILIILRYYNDFSYSDIGKVLGIKSETVKWKLHNSVKRLKSILVDNKGGDNNE